LIGLLVAVLATLSRLLGLLAGLLVWLLLAAVLTTLSWLLGLLAGLAAPTLLPALMLRIGIFRIIGHRITPWAICPIVKCAPSKIVPRRSIVAQHHRDGPSGFSLTEQSTSYPNTAPDAESDACWTSATLIS
jgi:hypothetical protein